MSENSEELENKKCDKCLEIPDHLISLNCNHLICPICALKIIIGSKNSINFSILECFSCPQKTELEEEVQNLLLEYLEIEDLSKKEDKIGKINENEIFEKNEKNEKLENSEVSEEEDKIKINSIFNEKNFLGFENEILNKEKNLEEKKRKKKLSVNLEKNEKESYVDFGKISLNKKNGFLNKKILKKEKKKKKNLKQVKKN